MTAIPSIQFPTMDMTNQDEHMDFASDHPFHDDNDVDFDAVSMHDASRGPSVEADVMIEDITEVTDEPKLMADDEMLDEDLIGDEPSTTDQIFDNGDDANSATMYDDEDLLYEDDEVLVDGPGDQEDVDLGDGDALFEAEGDAVHDEVLDDETIVQLNEIQTDSAVTAEPDTQSLDNLNEGHENYDTSVSRNADEQDSHEDGYGEINNQEHETAFEGDKAEELESPETTFDGSRLANDGSNLQVPEGTSNDNASTDSLVKAPQPVQTSDKLNTEQDNLKEEVSDETQTTGDQVHVPGVHPVKVQYDGTELCLFPPNEGADTFFVQDASLAFSPCDQLLNACREVLGDSLAEDHELVLDIPALGLHLSEGSTYSSQLTMAQILDVYLALCLNDDGLEAAAPLSCTLRTRISLASQYAFLLSTANEGKGLAHLQANDHVNPDDEDETPYTGDPNDSSTEAVDHDSWGEDTIPTAADQSVALPAEVDVSTEDKTTGRPEEHSANTENPAAALPDDSTLPALDEGRDDDDFDADDSAPVTDLQDEPEGNPDLFLFTYPDSENFEWEIDYSLANMIAGTYNEDHQDEATKANANGDSDSDDTVRGETIESQAVGTQSESATGIAVADFATGHGVEESKVDIPEPDVQSAASGAHDDQHHAVLLETTDADGAADEDALSEISDNLLGLDEFDDQTENDAEYEGSKADAEAAEPAISADGDFVDGDDAANNNNLVLVDSPEAMSNGQAQKRKAVDEDDFDLLEPETPEKKKRRPS